MGKINITQEEKELLLKDLCARLPYGVIVRHADCIIDDNYNETGEFHYTKGYLYDICRMDDMTTTIIESEGEREGYEHICLLERTVPYLRPMSSMTEEEKKEYRKVCELDTEILTNHPMNGEPFPALYNSQDWLNAHHFDYRGLIEKGLALEALEGMYN